MSNMKQVEENVASASNPRTDSFSSSDHAAIAELQRAYRERLVIPCTKCNYCMPCPNDVNIPRNFELFNDVYLHEDSATSRFIYQNFFPKEQHSTECIACKTCEDACPQGIPISQWMPKVSSLLAPATP
jgi:predicted aldo/keto reductase-like oxidoreductase